MTVPLNGKNKSKHVQNRCMKMLQTKGKPCNSYVTSPLETTCVYQQPTTHNQHHLDNLIT